MRAIDLLKGLIISCSIAYSSIVSAVITNYSISTSLRHSDNINLEPDQEQSELSESVRGLVSIEEDTANVVANVLTTLETINYHDNELPDENIGKLSANILWKVKPNQFEWFLSDIYTQSAIDIFDALSPLNKQNVNTFVTGPNYIIRLSRRNYIHLEARFTNNSYEKNLDNNELQGVLRWVYKLNKSTDIGFNYSGQAVDYENQINDPNYDRNDLFFNLKYTKGLNLFDIEVGSTDINYNNRDNVDTDRYKLSWQSQRSRTDILRLEYDNVLSNTGNELAVSINNIIDELDDFIITTNDAFIKKQISLIYDKKTSYGDLELTVRETNNSYISQKIFDHKVSSIAVRNTFDVSSRTRIQLNLRYQKLIYDDISVDRQDDDRRYDFIYAYRAKRNINLTGRITSRSRESTSVQDQYDELRYLATFEYIIR